MGGAQIAEIVGATRSVIIFDWGTLNIQSENVLVGCASGPTKCY